MHHDIEIALGTLQTLGAGGGAKALTARPIKVDPAQQFAAKGDTIAFKTGGAGTTCFTLFFPDDSPFKDVDEIHSLGAPTTGKFTVAAKARRPYRYYVAVRTTDDILMIASCPEIIIR
ncbi:MAG: hypothetical protein ABR567_14150 [Myxococcales bacterium]